MEMSFTIQVIVDIPSGDNLKAKHWQIWIVCLIHITSRIDFSNLDVATTKFRKLIRGEYQEVHTYSTYHHLTMYA